MNWYEFESKGWSWAVGYSSSLGSYYAQAWRDLPKNANGVVEPVYVNGLPVWRECFSEVDSSTLRAEANLQQRLRQLE